MVFIPKEQKDLFSEDKMSGFFGKNCRLFFDADRLISTKIIPQKRIAKNIVILYKLLLSKNGKKFYKNVWGKTMERDQYELIDFLSKSEVKNHLPRYFEYLFPLKFSLSEEVEGKPIRKFEKKFSFWQKNVSKIGKLLAEFQNLKIPKKILKVYTKGEEKKHLQSSFEKIHNYSKLPGNRYRALGEFYFKQSFSQCWAKRYFSFNHFDFQPSNILYAKESDSFVVLDFDLAKKFSPALDLANFWVHVYVMLRYNFSKEKTLLICDKFLKSYLYYSKEEKKRIGCFDVFKMRAIIDIAQITADVFKKPSGESQKVFDKLDELLKTY